MARTRTWKNCILLSAFVSLLSPSAWASYKLGPQDKLRVKVFEWRATKGELFEWTAVSGDFTIGPNGKVMLPLLGEIPADGRSATELANTISEGLQNQIGLLQKPHASVEVIQFRPFYIIGSVDKPGEYQYRPGLTVLQAVGIAGGMYRPRDDMLRSHRESIASRGELRVLSATMNSLLARRARLHAELQDAKAIEFPPELTDRRNDLTIAVILREEQLIFQTRRDAIQRQTEALLQQKQLLSKEIETLRAQEVLKGRQLDSIQKELSSVKSLVEKGLTVAPRQLLLERNAAEFESRQLELTTSILKAGQDLNKAERDILALKNDKQTEVALELRLTQNKLEEVSEKLATAQRLVYETEVMAPEMAAKRNAQLTMRPVYSILRREGSETREMSAAEEMVVEPGDVINVQPALGTQDMVGLYPGASGSTGGLQ